MQWLSVNFWKTLAVALMLLVASGAWADKPIWLDNFSSESEKVPVPWQVVQLDSKIPPTQYRVLRWDGVLAIEARAERSRHCWHERLRLT